MEVSPRRPFTWAQPVMPGRTWCLTMYRGISSLNWSTKWGSSGLGPTRLMSPLSTLKNWGSSSMENLRMKEPNRVFRGSELVLHPVSELAFTRMDRNLYI